jgi:hypothetical protein
MGGTPIYYPTLTDKADPTKEIRKVTDYLRALVQGIQLKVDGLPVLFLTRAMADSLYSPAVLRRMLQTGGTFFLNVTDLPGVLAQPQVAGVKTGTSTPNLLSPLSQNGTLFVLTPGNTLYFFDGSSAPGTWRSVSAAPTSGYTTIQQDGAPLTQRSVLNVISAGGLLATDDAGGSRTQLAMGTVPVANGGTGSTSLADGTNIKHKRITTGSIAATTRADVTLNWTTNFSDTNYSATATVEDTSASGLGLIAERIRSKAVGSVIVQVFNQSAGPLTGVLDCIAIHD